MNIKVFVIALAAVIIGEISVGLGVGTGNNMYSFIGGGIAGILVAFAAIAAG